MHPHTFSLAHAHPNQLALDFSFVFVAPSHTHMHSFKEFAKIFCGKKFAEEFFCTLLDQPIDCW